jgi:uncharacterized protein DUF5946
VRGARIPGPHRLSKSQAAGGGDFEDCGKRRLSVTTVRESVCPGCGLRLPARPDATYEGNFNASPECWSLFTEILGAEFGNAVLFGQVHQLTVDSYAVQHPGGRHPDKSVAVHLSGMHLMLDRGVAPTTATRLLQRLADSRPDWPHFPPPENRGFLTIGDVVRSGSLEAHVESVRKWAREVWGTWAPRHAEVARFVARHLD